jgi:hypothetical protein
MGRYRIHCKIHDSQERVTRVGIGDKTFTKDEVWDWFDRKEHSFYTYERAHEAEVRGAIRDGRKYLTTNPDGVTDNNLDELPRCQ